MATKIAGTTYRPLGSQTEPKMTAHDIICLHTMVGYLTSTDAMFKQNGYSGTESHFGIGGIWGSDRDKNLDGVVYQWQDLEYTADANLDGNWHVVSIETADNAPKAAKDLAAWTPKQCAAIIKLVASLCKKYNIPAVLIADTKRGRRGIAYHRQGCDPWRVDGGELWSNAFGKECPGTARIKQISEVIIPGVKKTLAGVPLDLDMEDEIMAMSDAEKKAFAQLIAKEVINAREIPLDNGPNSIAGTLLAQNRWRLQEMTNAEANQQLLKTISEALKADTSDGVSEAFEAGIAKFQAAVEDIKLTVSSGPGT